MLFEDEYPKEEMLKSASALNKDGGGIAWIEEQNGNKLVRWRKGMDMTSEKVMKLIKEENIQLPIVIHYRIATHGKIDTPLCHPFAIDDNQIGDYDLQGEGFSNDGVLFHNGVWRDYKEIAMQIVSMNPQAKIPDGDISDSRIMAWACKYFGMNYLSMIDEKVVVLTTEGIKKYGSGWTEVEKIRCSNDNFTWRSNESYYKGGMVSGSLNGKTTRTGGTSLKDQKNRKVKAKAKGKAEKKDMESKHVSIMDQVLKTETAIEEETKAKHDHVAKLSSEEYELLFSDSESYMQIPEEAFNSYTDWQEYVSKKQAELRVEDVD